jgi:hypothetical protein
VRASDLYTHLSIMELKAATSVRLGNTYVLPNDIQKCVAHYADRLTYFANDDGWSVSQAGSATPVAFKDRYLLLATQHQLKGCDIGGICMETYSVQNYKSSNQYNWVKPTEPHKNPLHVHDLCAFDFSDAVKSGDISVGRFFNLLPTTCQTRDEQAKKLFSIGFAYADDQMHVEEDEESEHLGRLLGKHSKKRILICDLESVSKDGESFTMKRIGDRDVNPDGFSGGPVYSLIHEADGSFVLKFSGITFAGNNTILHAFSAWEILPILHQMFPESP